MAEPKPGDLYTLRFRPTWMEGYTSCAGVGSVVEVVEINPGSDDEARVMVATCDGALAIVPIGFLADLAGG